VRRYALLVTLLLIAAALRLSDLGGVPLRGDEAYSVVHWTATPFSEDWWQLWRDEPAPAGAFTMYWLWTGLVGESEMALRLISVLGNLLGAAAIVALGRRVFGGWLPGLLAGLLWAVHPFLIWHAQDARVYGVLSGLSPLAFYWLLRALEGERRAWPAYVGLQTLALYLYYLEPFWMAAQGAYVLLGRDRQALRRLIGAWIVIGVLYLPVAAQLYTLMVVSEYQGNAQGAELGALFSWFVPTLLFGDNTWPVAAGVIVAGALLAGLIAYARRFDRRDGLLLALWAFLPVILLTGASLVSDFFRPRYVMTVIPALILALVALTRFHAALRVALTLLIVGASVVEIRDYTVNDPPKAPDWPGLMAYLEPRLTPHTTVLFDAPDPGIEYYFPAVGAPYILPLDWYATDWQAELDRLLREEDAVFLMSGPFSGQAAAYLQGRAQTVPGDRWPNVNQFRPWEVDPREIAQPLDLRFGDVAVLRGVTLLGSTTLMLYWEPLARTEVDYSVLLHLEIAPDAPVIALDHAPAAAIISTRTWEPGVVYRDPVALPADLAPGTYTIRVGLYPAGQPDARLAAAGDDRPVVGTLVID
jgi:hypothetical protein